MFKVIHDPTTKEERQNRGKEKDKEYRKIMKELRYKDEGELYLLSLKNACIRKLMQEDDYQLS